MVASLDEERNHLLGRISFLLCVILAVVLCMGWDVFQIVDLLRRMTP